MKYNLITLDGRYRGSYRFKYRLEFKSYVANERIQNFQTMLEWLWDSYGPGCDRDHYSFLFQNMQLNNIPDPEEKGPQWAWYVDRKDQVAFLYLRTDEILSHIKLKWT